MSRLSDAARQINETIQAGETVIASWNGCGVEIVSAKCVEKEDGEHLYGYENNGKEHCIGGALVRAGNTIGTNVITLWNAGK